VLVAEPDAALRLRIVAALSYGEVLPLAVATPEAAQEAAEATALSAAILECCFPRCTPGSAITALRRTAPSLPIICTTERTYRSAAFEAGADAVITKPYQLAYVVQCTMEALYRQQDGFRSTLR
jgi:DNA-binding response OmpR family regulator